MAPDSTSQTLDQIHDQIDGRTILFGDPTYDPDLYWHYDNLSEYANALADLRYNATDALAHELSHGTCALAVGVIGVKYGIEYTRFQSRGRTVFAPFRAVASLYGPSRIPRLAAAAIAAAPKDPSADDLQLMRRLSYPSVEYLIRRIKRWNAQSTGLHIPVPGSIDTHAEDYVTGL